MKHITLKFISNNQVPLLLLGTVIVFYLPILYQPSLILERNNDLQEQFWPMFYFIKQQILLHHSLPFWNNLFFSGMPLLPDPQFSLFYLPNWLFVLLPTNAAFIILFLLHTFMGGIGFYLLANKAIRLPKTAAIFSAVLYIISPRLAGYLEAGHFGLVASLAWLPILALAVIETAKRPRLFWSLILSLSLAAIFFLHTVTFFWAAISTAILAIFTLAISEPIKQWVKPLSFYLLSLVLMFGLTAVTLLPQLEWTSHTTRLLLLQTPDVYPKWSSVKEFFQVIIAPWSINGSIWTIDTEKWLVLGITPVLLALIGWWRLSNKLKAIISTTLLITILISLNNASPVYNLLMAQPWYQLLRVSTRLWFIPLLITTLLAGRGLSFLPRKLIPLIMVLSIAELLTISWGLILKPVPDQLGYAPPEVYQYLKQDQTRYRVFCLNRCFSQQEVALNNLETVEGYNTLQQINYYKHFWQLSGGYWNYYTLALPPMGSPKLNPDYESLGLYNTKYIISPSRLTNPELTEETKFGSYYLYRNLLAKPRAYFWVNRQAGKEASVTFYSPNYIRIGINNQESKSIVLAEVFSEGWKAYLNGKEEIPIQETPNSLRLVDITPNTEYIDFLYLPPLFEEGIIITTLSLITVIVMIALKLKRKNHS